MYFLTKLYFNAELCELYFKQIVAYLYCSDNRSNFFWTLCHKEVKTRIKTFDQNRFDGAARIYVLIPKSEETVQK